MTMEGTVIEILGYPSRFFRRDAIMPATIEPRKAATAGGTAAISTSSRRNVLATAPISAAAAAIETGLLNMMEKPKTPQKPAINRRRKSNNGAISKGRKSVGTKSRSIAMIQAVSVATSTMITAYESRSRPERRSSFAKSIPLVMNGKPGIIKSMEQIYPASFCMGTENIKETLEARGLRNAAGTTEWTTSNLRTILSDEKYCGDVLRQKTFIRDCISKQVVKNTGQRPKYLIQNHHDAIIPREQFDAVQFEMARRRAQTDRSRKSVPTGTGKYSGKYALSGLLFCGECGTAYRRVVWTQHGEKRAVWRCTSRLDYGKKYCKDSPTLDEEPLQQAVLAAINASMSDHGILTAQLTDAMEQELAPIPGESMSLGDIDRAIAELGKQFDHLLLEASGAGVAEEYAERFRAISTAMEELKRRKANIQNIRQEQEQVTRRVQAAVSVLDGLSAELTQWDDNVVYQMLEKVTVLSREMIRVTLRNGVEIEQTVEQPKRRKSG